MIPPRSTRLAGLWLSLATLLASGQAAAQTAAADSHAALLHSFGRRSSADQERLLQRVRAEVARIESPLLVAAAKLAAEAKQEGKPRASKLPTRRTKKRIKGHHPTDWATLAPPFRVRYVFGRGVIEPVDPPHPGSAAARKSRIATLRGLLEGRLPDSDLALASLLRHLDRDTRGDDFSAFLRSWRNGRESFYQALDRTAGTKQSLFFYDAMLGDFTAKIVRPTGSTGPRQSLQASHDALHRAFLAYRQYRAFREALALSLILAPDQPLPQNLQRYEAKVAGAYSLRQQVTMVLAVEHLDVAKVADLVAATAPPLPSPLWKGRYDPYVAWNEIFRARMPAMIEAAGSTDAFLAEAEKARRSVTHDLREATAKALALGP